MKQKKLKAAKVTFWLQWQRHKKDNGGLEPNNKNKNKNKKRKRKRKKANKKKDGGRKCENMKSFMPIVFEMSQLVTLNVTRYFSTAFFFIPV